MVQPHFCKKDPKQQQQQTNPFICLYMLHKRRGEKSPQRAQLLAFTTWIGLGLEVGAGGRDTADFLPPERWEQEVYNQE